MKYEIIGDGGVTPEIAFLCPRIQVQEVEKYYYNPYLKNLGQQIMVCDLYKERGKKKTPAGAIKEYLNQLVPHLLDANIKLLVVTQPDYFKVITKNTKTDATIGDVLPTIFGNNLYATYCPNYGRVFYDPDKIKAKIDIALNSVKRWISGDKLITGENIIKFSAYPTKPEEIEQWLEDLLAKDCDLTIDIEAFSLKHYDSGIGTITFCWDKHKGIAFPVDYKETKNNQEFQGKMVKNHRIRKALRSFFERYKRKAIYHNICYDAYILIYQLFMDDILDYEGLLHGLNIMLRNWDCTQLITYLATNSCAGNELGLKAQAQEYAGNYAVDDIKDIRKIPLHTLLEYNLIDGLSTWFVKEKNEPIMEADNQRQFYNEIFTPAVKDIIQMQLTGMPINMLKVKKLDKTLKNEAALLMTKMNSFNLVSSFIDQMEDELVIKKNASYKKKVITKDDLKPDDVVFNPNSAPQLQKLLYSEEFLGLPVLDLTKSKLPATGAETLEKLLNHTEDPEVLDLLKSLIEFKASAIIISTFLPAMLQAQQGSDGWYYLFGNFRLGGTISGRLSSNNPNLQNIPSAGSTAAKQRLAKLIKECFEAPPAYWKINQNMLQTFILELKQSLKGA